MGLYFFDMMNGVEMDRDDTGTHLPNREEARLHAHLLLKDLAIETLPCGQRRDLNIDVRDSRGVVIYSCMLSLFGRWLDFSLPPMGDRGSVFEA